jgi:hypothetical protein
LAKVSSAARQKTSVIGFKVAFQEKTADKSFKTIKINKIIAKI